MPETFTEEELIIQGIIEKNINYFIENYGEMKSNNLFKENLNNYINGDFLDYNDVYYNIVKLSKVNINKLMEIFETKLNIGTYNTFVEKFHNYLIFDCKEIFTKKIELLNDMVSNKFLQNKLLENPIICERILKNVIIETKFTSFTSNTSIEFFLKILKNKELRPKIMDYFEENIKFIKDQTYIIPIYELDDSNIQSKIIVNTFKYNLAIILIHLFLNGINELRLHYISKDTDNFLSKIYYYIHEIIEYGVLNIYEDKYSKIKDYSYIKKLNSENRMTKNSYDFLSTRLETYLKGIKYLVHSKFTNNKLIEFLDKSIYWVNNRLNKNHHCDEILENINQYYKFKFNQFELTKESSIMISNIFNNDSITKNPNIKINFLKVINGYLVFLNKKNFKKFRVNNFIEYDKDINNISINLLEIFHKIQVSYDEEEIYNSTFANGLITNIFNLTIYNTDHYRYNFEKKLKKNIKLFKEFVYSNLNNFQYELDEILSFIIKIKEIEDVSEPSENLTKSDKINIIIDKINNLNIYLESSSKFILKTTKFNCDIILSNEIKNCFVNIIITFINKLVMNSKKYKICKETHFKPIEILVVIKKCLINCYIHRDDIIIDLICKNQSYTKNSIKRLINILDKRSLIKPIDFNTLDYIQSLLEKNIIENEEYEDIDIPDEFCDPIMDTLIENPVMLPNNIIMDYDVISRHLLTNETNPFNRVKLTLNILSEYNKQDSVKEKIDEFKLKLKPFLHKK